jgi:hypothetical protein
MNRAKVWPRLRHAWLTFAPEALACRVGQGGGGLHDGRGASKSIWQGFFDDFREVNGNE